ncbi:MAG: protease pro-enzyme activation domain-containing protein [Verrucomicrobiia bacterium]
MRHLLRWLAILCLVVLFTMTAQGQERQVLNGHVPRVVTSLNLQPIGLIPSETRLHLAIGLPLRNKEELNALLQQIYDPTSSQYRHYLTTEQFTEMFGPTKQDYQAVVAFAKSQGFTVTTMYPNRLLLDVEGAASDVENAFQVKMLNYQHPTEARTFYAPDVEPSVPSGIKILDISGISNYPRPHPMSHVGKLTSQASSPTPNSGSGPGGNYIGYDFRAAYVPGTSLTGTGQSIALVQFDGYYPSDIAAYESRAGLPAVTLTNVLLDGFSGVPTTGPDSGNGEVSLDIEMVISMAPGVSKVIVYEGNMAKGFFNPNDVLARIANDNIAKQVSCSWAWNLGPSVSTDNFLIQMVSQGQSFFVASGDSDAYPGATVDDPSNFGTPVASSNVTSVGGTTLSTSGLNWASETVWNWGVEYGSSENGRGSSGGYSSYYTIPIWQRGVPPGNLGSTTGRNFPDVALTADHVFVAYGNGLTNWFGGTSCAAPLWAGFTALVNQQAAANGHPAVGFLNPAIYTIGTGTTYNACFHDIITGNNEWSNSPSAYSATNGYDLCTGWGTPNGTNLINALAGSAVSGSITVTPAARAFGSVSTSVTAQASFTITNPGSTTVTNGTATVIGGGPFTVVSNATFSVPGSGSTNVVVQFAPSSIGAFSNNIIFATANGGSATNIMTGTGVSLVPVASFTASPTNGVAPLMVTFTDHSSGSITNRFWDFGDSSTNTPLSSFVHVYNADGTYTVGLTVSGPNGSSTTNRTNYIVVTSTNAPPDTTPPTLTVSSPTDYQAFTNAVITVTGTASDDSGIRSVTVNGAAASVIGTTNTNWSAPFTLAFGTNTITVVATDNSLYMNTATTNVHAISSVIFTNHAPVITTPPVVTNALSQVGDVAVVAAGETNVFLVGAFDSDGNQLSYQWSFGDGNSSGWLITNIASHAYATNCGPYTAGVTVYDGTATASSNLTVTVACELFITKLQVKLNFAKTNSDSCTLTASFDPGTGFSVANKLVTLDIGGAQVPFTMGAKGKGVSSFGSCKLAYNKKTGLWALTANLAKGTWRTQWSEHGLSNATIFKPGASVTVPVIVLIGDEAFADERSMLYTATKGKSGSAK